ncbi:MAG: Lrp/AsnC family transcriptional regulator [Candidatus Diapherotrites archaeon]|nr:Lrp/AsnC family transcriptional regulator [Candidatus Diapherotrites archaeon]
MELDSVDLKILRLLLQDGRTSYAQIAKETKLSDVAVKKRVEKLMSRGVIKKITAILDREKLGLRYTFFIQLRVDPSEIYMVYRKLASLPNVLEVYVVAGEFPIIAKAVGESVEDLKRMISEIGKIDGVLDVKTSVVLEGTEKEISIPSKIGQRVLG